MEKAVKFALLLLAVSARAAAPDRIKPLRPIVGQWSGQVNCKTGNYETTIKIEELEGGLFAHYGASSLGVSPLKADGDVGVAPRPKAGEFAATSNGVAVKVSLAEKGQVLIFAPLPSSNELGDVIKFAGTARLDKKRTKAVVRFTVKSPVGADSCMGSMSRNQP